MRHLRQRSARTAPGSSQRQRVRSWVLLVALLPSLTFVGHWSPRIDIPGTNLYVGLPELPAAHSHVEPTADGHDHQSHCHTDAGSCSDVPFAGASAFALLNGAVALMGSYVALIALLALAWRPAGSHGLTPELQPPRGSAGIALSMAGA